ncbi:MAG: FecR domain-containing protein [Lentisphaerae bacterium]|nr:FecR domain-containing protein [Lentisphaerota bacterium]
MNKMKSTEPTISESDCTEIRNKTGLANYLAQSVPEARHLSLSEIEALAQSLKDGDEILLPAHLSLCPICLEILEAISTADKLEPDQLKKFVHMVDTLIQPTPRLFSRPWFKIALAASFAIILGIAYLLTHKPVHAGKIKTGSFTTADGKELQNGNNIPTEIFIVPVTNAKLELTDSSSVAITENSSVKVAQNILGGVSMELAHGKIEAEVTSQKPWNRFVIKTQLGSITVVGTRFSVEVKEETLEVTEVSENYPQTTSYTQKINSATILVHEGIVLLNNGFDKREVTAGETAVMKEGHRLILVKPATNPIQIESGKNL